MTTNHAAPFTLDQIMDLHALDGTEPVAMVCLTCGSIAEATDDEHARTTVRLFDLTCCNAETTVFLPFLK